MMYPCVPGKIFLAIRQHSTDEAVDRNGIILSHDRGMLRM
jgi:hypothetical protein